METAVALSGRPLCRWMQLSGILTSFRAFQPSRTIVVPAPSGSPSDSENVLEPSAPLFSSSGSRNLSRTANSPAT